MSKKQVMTGSDAVAYGAMLAEPQVVAAYPITPQSHITERVAKFVADGELKAEYVKVESEFSAISCAVGASATGVRTFTATASQGLALMHEILFAASGMRLPIVMPVANRALSAPINIWNDIQDAISERDNGWIQIFTENNQEALDTTIQAYKIAENDDVLLPVMVNLDGFFLTHTVEPTEVPDQEKVRSFLGKYKGKKIFLDPDKPMTQGPFAYPEPYYDLKQQHEEALMGAEKVAEDVDKEFGKIFGRSYGLLEKTKTTDTMVVTLGTLCGTARVACEDKYGMLKIRLYRPFPAKAIKEALKGVKKLVVIEKDIAMGLGGGVLATELRNIFYPNGPEIYSFVAGLGGKDVTVEDVKGMIKKVESGKAKSTNWQ